MNTSENVYVPSKRAIWMVRVMFCLFIIWLIGAIYLHQQVVQSRAKVEQNRIAAQRKEERIRRAAQYQQDVQQRTKAPQKRNAFGGK